MRKDGELENLNGVKLGMGSLHKHVLGRDIDGTQCLKLSALF